MFRIDEYIDKLIDSLKDAFGERLVYIGLQGSYLRNEETKNSDIDIMAVIDNISVEDLKTYQKALVSIGNFDKSCGFICCKADLQHWNPLEICHRYVYADREYNISKLPVTCKSIFFIMQHLYYLSNGNFVLTKRELLECVQDEDETVLELSISLQNCIDYDFDKAFFILFNWCQNMLLRI